LQNLSFKINIDDSILEDLRLRLDRTRFPDQLDGVGWDYGTDLDYLKKLVHYWRTDFDWRKQERRLNEFPQFMTEIDGVNIHFIHFRSQHENAMPLVLAHGWPDSVFGFQKVIGPLTDPEAHGGKAEDAFHVVCPSMAGYGFSSKPSDRGWSVDRMGGTAAKLMAKLGYTRYGAQGGDWGSGVASWLGRNDAEHVAGIHLNLVGVGPPRDMENPEEGIPEWELKRSKDRRKWWNASEGAYGNIQGTKPQTLGYGLNDSPAGLAAWIVEKWRTWADTNGDIESKFTKDELLTNVMIYWTTASITSSTRLYYESRHNPRDRGRVGVPTAVAIFPRELGFSPRKWVETAYNVKQWTEMPRGGHFAAMEEPQLFVEDVRKFFRTVR
jgi:pimeloyl-ACP methyl ester carboxylesterase